MSVAFEIRARHLWDGETGWTGPVSVGVEGDRIRSVGKDGAPAPEGGAETLRLRPGDQVLALHGWRGGDRGRG